MISTQRIATCSREGRHPSICLERYKEALADKRAGPPLPGTDWRAETISQGHRKALQWQPSEVVQTKWLP